jgi:hypothetical protein
MKIISSWNYNNRLVILLNKVVHIVINNLYYCGVLKKLAIIIKITLKL